MSLRSQQVEVNRKPQRGTENQEPPREGGLHGVLRILYPLMIFYAAVFLVEGAFAIVNLIQLRAQNPALAQDSDALLDATMALVTEQSLAIMMVRSLLLIPIFILLYRRDFKVDRIYGREKTYPPLCKWWLLTLPIVGFTAAIGFNQVITLLDLKRFSPNYQKVDEIVYSGNLFMTYFSSAVLAPVVEELLFRGLIYKRARNHVKPIWASLISALLFGLIHGNLVQFVYAFLVGMIICWVYEKFQTIWAPIIFHAGANLISVIITLLLPEFGGGLSVGQYMLLTVGWLAATFMILWLYHKKIHRDPISVSEHEE